VSARPSSSARFRGQMTTEMSGPASLDISTGYVPGPPRRRHAAEADESGASAFCGQLQHGASFYATPGAILRWGRRRCPDTRSRWRSRLRLRGWLWQNGNTESRYFTRYQTSPTSESRWRSRLSSSTVVLYLLSGASQIDTLSVTVAKRQHPTANRCDLAGLFFAIATSAV
jgi:hypothetical protein